jgi:hypothetical protein
MYSITRFITKTNYNPEYLTKTVEAYENPLDQR